MLPLMIAEFNGEAYDGDVTEFINIYNQLTDTQKACYVTMGNRLYAAGVMRYYNTLLTEANVQKNLAAAVLSADTYYWIFMITGSKDTLSAFAACMTNLNATVDGITDETDKENFESILGDLYSF